ncbi:MAG: hypothetical protein KDA79_01945 [Planctomycetaceae bacterium]|nr:hypothetical protein [Planctomycetaceae bacterium]
MVQSAACSGENNSRFTGRNSPGILAAAVVPAVLAWGLVWATLDPGLAWPDWPAGPGITIDESFNVQQGVRLAVGLPLFLDGSLTLRELFGDANDLPGGNFPIGQHLADHPPLARFWIGVAHQWSAGANPQLQASGPFITACGRNASAQAFGLLVLLVGWTAARWYGPVPGAVAGLSLILMPRLFAHAHLASLETILCLLWTAAVLCVASYWPASPNSPATSESSGSRDGRAAESPAEGPPPCWQTVLLTGVVFGLLLLTKIHAVLLTVPVGLWALWHWRMRAVFPLVLWGATGLVVFFLGWPWLWIDPAGHLVEYFGRTTGRVPLNVWYLGRQWLDRDVPFHYPWVMSLFTMPVGLTLLGGLGLAGGPEPRGQGTAAPHSPARAKGEAARFPSAGGRHGLRVPGWLRDLPAREQLLLAAVLFPLVVFSVPGIAVYDGVRLFLVSFPLWGIFAGRGAAVLLQRAAVRVTSGRAKGLLYGVLLLQAVGVIQLHPLQLSYYSLAAGGTRGAAWLGLEATYWQDSLNREMLEAVLEHVPAGAAVAVTPVLHQFQVADLQKQNPRLSAAGLKLVPWLGSEQEPAAGANVSTEPRPEYLLLFRRLADLSAELQVGGPPGWEAVADVRRGGVTLAGLYRRTEE